MSGSEPAQLLLVLVLILTGYCWGQEVNCTTGDLRLFNSSAPGQGMLQQCNSSNLWSAVCNYAWDCVDAKVACQQLGFNDSRPNIFADGYFGTWDSMSTEYYSCAGSEKSLQDCNKYVHYQCNIGSYPNRMAGLACHSPPGECTHGDLRLVGGASESEGRVEVCYKGGWYSVCGMEDEEASVMCKQLGHTVYPWAAVFTDGRFGQTPLSQGYMGFECSTQFSEDKWTECTVSALSCTSCNGEALKCFTPPECEEGSLRVVDGVIDNEGRVEICLQGVWGTINSYSGWSSIDAYVACKQLELGTSGKSPTTYTTTTASKFGDGKQPQVMYSPYCYGWENTLTDCGYNLYGNFFRSRTYTAGILCFDDCKDGEVRLVGGGSEVEGTVEVCLGNLWGLVAESGWSRTDAQVICNQLGFPLDEVQAVNKSHYGKPKKPVHLSNVHCTGSEQQILSCAHFEFMTLDEKKQILSHLDVAGVSCQPQNQTGNQTNIGTSGKSCDLTSAAVLLVPAYLTMLVVIAGLILTTVVAAVSLRKRKSQVSKEKSLPMASLDICNPRYMSGKQDSATVAPPPPPRDNPRALYPANDSDEPMYEYTETSMDY